jgi:anti-sigma factor RsiW
LQGDDRTLLLHAALDGELDAVSMIEIEAKLAADPKLAAEHARLVALRNAIRRRVPRQRVPHALTRACDFDDADRRGGGARAAGLRSSPRRVFPDLVDP